jgi:hypothetical protein
MKIGLKKETILTIINSEEVSGKTVKVKSSTHDVLAPVSHLSMQIHKTRSLSFAALINSVIHTACKGIWWTLGLLSISL